MITDEMVQEICRMRDEGISRNRICKKLHIGYKTVNRILGEQTVRRDAQGVVPRGWVINHPYQESLREEDRQRYLEVVQQRQQRDPDMGWDYETREHVTYKNGVIHRPC